MSKKAGIQGKRDYTPSDADRLFVERAVMAGSSIVTISECLNIHDDTLRKHFRYEIVTGRERLKGDAVRVLMDSLTDNSLDAAKFVLGRVAGWSEKTVNEHGGIGGGPIQTQEVSALERITGRIAGIAARSRPDEDTGGTE